ncbi:MAG: murein transglycosylase A, partial [Hyphomicrobiaceae bacterium]
RAGRVQSGDLGFAKKAPKSYFEAHYVPHRVVHPGPNGLLTGYYEPVLRGSRHSSADYPVPLYRQPEDLVKVEADAARGYRNDTLVAGRMIDGDIVPYFTRREIELGALDDLGLDFLYLADPIDAFFLHVQGSGLIELDDGTSVRIGYAAKNGHPYTSIGRVLIERGEIAESDMTLAALRTWLETHPEQAADVMRENASFIFFQEHNEADVESAGPVGSLGVTLTDGRSLAVDTSYHELGTPVFVSSATLDCHGSKGFHRLMVAQDVGSAIRGPERGDIFWGTGDEAGRLAGETIHEGTFFVLLPRQAGSSQ